MFKDYNTGLGTYIKDALNIEVFEAKRDEAFGMFAKHQDANKLSSTSLPFASYFMSGDVELDTTRYNAYVHRVGEVVSTNSITERATRVRSIPIIHPYTIDFWAPGKSSLENLQRTFWITVLDNPIVRVFNRDVDRAYRVSLDITSSTNEFVSQDEDRAGYHSSTLNVSLGVRIRLSAECNTVQKTIVNYIEEPENYILAVREYT